MIMSKSFSKIVTVFIARLRVGLEQVFKLPVIVIYTLVIFSERPTEIVMTTKMLPVAFVRKYKTFTELIPEQICTKTIGSLLSGASSR